MDCDAELSKIALATWKGKFGVNLGRWLFRYRSEAHLSAGQRGNHRGGDLGELAAGVQPFRLAVPKSRNCFDQHHRPECARLPSGVDFRAACRNLSTVAILASRLASQVRGQNLRW